MFRCLITQCPSFLRHAALLLLRGSLAEAEHEQKGQNSLFAELQFFEIVTFCSCCEIQCFRLRECESKLSCLPADGLFGVSGRLENTKQTVRELRECLEEQKNEYRDIQYFEYKDQMNNTGWRKVTCMHS